MGEIKGEVKPVKGEIRSEFRSDYDDFLSSGGAIYGEANFNSPQKNSSHTSTENRMDLMSPYGQMPEIVVSDIPEVQDQAENIKKDPVGAINSLASKLKAAEPEEFFSTLTQLASKDSWIYGRVVDQLVQTYSLDKWKDSLSRFTSVDAITDGVNLQHLFQIYTRLWENNNELDNQIQNTLINAEIWSSRYETEKGSQYFALPSGATLRYRPNQSDPYSSRLQPPTLLIGFVPEETATQWTKAIDSARTFISGRPKTAVQLSDISITFDQPDKGILTIHNIRTQPTIGYIPLEISTSTPGRNLSQIQQNIEGDTSVTTMVLVKSIGHFIFPPDHRGHKVSKIIK